MGKTWSTQVTVVWRALVSLVSDSITGIKVQVAPAQIKPVFEKKSHHGELGETVFKNVYEQLTLQLPQVIDLSSPHLANTSS